MWPSKLRHIEFFIYTRNFLLNKKRYYVCLKCFCFLLVFFQVLSYFTAQMKAHRVKGNILNKPNCIHIHPNSELHCRCSLFRKDIRRPSVSFHFSTSLVQIETSLEALLGWRQTCISVGWLPEARSVVSGPKAIGYHNGIMDVRMLKLEHNPGHSNVARLLVNLFETVDRVLDCVSE